MKSVKNTFNFLPQAGQLFANKEWLEQDGEKGWYKIAKVENYPPQYFVVTLEYHGVIYSIPYTEMNPWRWKDAASKE